MLVAGLDLEAPGVGRFGYWISEATLGGLVGKNLLTNCCGEKPFSVAYPGDFFFQLSANAFLGLSLQPEDSIRFVLTSGRAIVYGATADNTTQEPEIFIATRTAD